MLTKNNIYNWLIIIILIAIAVSPAIALGKGDRNLLLIGVMSFSPIIILLIFRIYFTDIWLLLFMSSIMLIPLINHPESMRWSTVLYSVMFCLTFMAYNRLLMINSISVVDYYKLLRYLMYAYFIVLLIQQFCVLTSLPIFNVNKYIPSEPWKLNSLSAEPAFSARIIGLLMFCCITIKEIILGKKYIFIENIQEDKWLWLAFFWTMITMGSGTAFIFIPLVLLKFVRFRNIIPLILVMILITYFVHITGLSAMNRTFNFILATLTFDESTILKADRSAALRIVPIIIVAKMVTLKTIDGWLGHGIDYAGKILYLEIPGLEKGTSGGGMFMVWLEYGFISFLIFVMFSLLAVFRKGDYLTIVFWFLLVFLYGINNQMVWLCIILLYTNKYFSGIYLNSEEKQSYA